MQNEKLIEKLNSKRYFFRKLALKELKKRELLDGALLPNKDSRGVNLSIHTHHSFSPYSPTLAAYMAYKSGMKLVSACDYGTDKGAEEFAHACKVLGISSLDGFEATLRRENGEDAVCSFYSLSKECMQQFKPLLEEFRLVCERRARTVCEKINDKLKVHSLNIDFDKDVVSRVKIKSGSTLTIKHLFMATGEKLIEKLGKGKTLADFLRETLCLDIEEGVYNLLCDINNPFYKYDLISALRHNFGGTDANLTPPNLADFMQIAKQHGAIVAYQYNAPKNWLKNQTETQKTLEDFKRIILNAKEEGFTAISISSKNLNDDLVVQFVNLIKENNMLAVFTVKTEYPRNRFEVAVPSACREYLELCAYAMVGNLRSMLEDPNERLFRKNGKKTDDFYSRIMLFAQVGKMQRPIKD